MNHDKYLAAELINAVIDNDTVAVGDVLAEGLDPNISIDPACITALHYAAQSNSVEVIPILLEYGADISAQTEPDGYKPIDIAVLHGHDTIVQLLTSYLQATDASIN